MSDPFAIEEVLRITDCEKWKRSGAIDLYGVARNRTPVILSIEEYEELLEDLHDLSIIAERRDEPTITFEDIKKGLKEDGLL